MCVTEGTLTTLCEEHVKEEIDAYLTKYPRARELAARSTCGRCHEADEIADIYGWEAANAWDNIRWLLGDDA